MHLSYLIMIVVAIILILMYAPWPCTLKCWLSAWLPDMERPTGRRLDHHPDGAFWKKGFWIQFCNACVLVCQCVSVGVLVWLFATLAMCESVPSSSPCWGLFEISNLPLLFLSVGRCDCTYFSLFLKGFLSYMGWSCFMFTFVHKQGDPNLCPIGLRCVGMS